MKRFARFLLISSVLMVSSGLRAQYPSVQIPPVNPTKYQDCLDLSDRWSAKSDDVRAAENQCRSGYKPSDLNISKKGIAMPSCNEREYMFLKCAPISNQLCEVRAQREEAVSQCFRTFSAYQRAEQDKKSAASRLEQQIREVNEARNAMSAVAEKGPLGYAIDRMTETPQSAAARFQDAVKEAARTTGSPGADSQPGLNRVGETSDGLYRLRAGNPVATEIGSQSAAAARARMGDALNQLDGISSRAAAEDIKSTPSQTYVRGVNTGMGRGAETAQDEELEEQQQREDARARFEMLRQINEAAQRTLRSMTPPPTYGRSTTRSGTTGQDQSTAPRTQKCRSPEIKCNGPCTDGLRMCRPGESAY